MQTPLPYELSVRMMMLPVIGLALYMLDKTGWLSLAFVLLCAFCRLAVPLSVPRNRRIYRGVSVIAGIIIIQQVLQADWITSLFVLLVTAQGLTLLHLNQARSLYTLLWVQFFISAVVMMQYNQIHHALVILLLNGVGLFAIYQLNCPPQTKKPLSATRPFAYLLGACVPLAAILFVFIPRLPALWQMPKVSGQPQGLQETIRPGELANLSQMGGLAFRAEFAGPMPDQQALYWRAFTLDQFDGEQWQQSPFMKNIKQKIIQREIRIPPVTLSGSPIQYRVIVQPSQQHWLFSLDRAVSPNSDVRMMPDYSLIAAEPINKKRQYQVSSDLFAPLTDAYIEPSALLALPPGANPKTRQWVEQLQSKYSDPQQLSRAMMLHFNQGGFVYRLSVPKLGANSIDQFLFESKVGFCGHYASALTYMLRLAQIPARLVVGYQGGEYNPSGDYLAVYHSSAHAWVEAWIDQKWQRLDPTAMVEPDRLNLSLEALLGADQVYATQTFNVRRFDNWPAVRSVRLWLSSVDYYWTRWVLNYDDQQQQNFWQKLTGDRPVLQAIIMSLLILFFILLSWFFARYINLSNRRSDPALRVYQSCLKRLKVCGIAQTNQATPRQMLAKVEQSSPQLGRLWQLFCFEWDQYWYADRSQQERLKHLKKLKKIAAKFNRHIKLNKKIV